MNTDVNRRRDKGRKKYEEWRELVKDAAKKQGRKNLSDREKRLLNGGCWSNPGVIRRLSHLDKVIYQIGVQRGHDNEHRLVDVVNATPSHERPNFFYSIEHANVQEDLLKGIDVIVNLTGSRKYPARIGVQVKSSKLGRKKAIKAHPEVPVFIVNSEQTNTEIAASFFRFLTAEMNKRFQI